MCVCDADRLEYGTATEDADVALFGSTITRDGRVTEAKIRVVRFKMGLAVVWLFDFYERSNSANTTQ